MATNLVFDPGALTGFLLVLCRLGGALVFVPMPGFRMAAEPARILLILGLCVALYPLWPHVDTRSLTAGRLAVWIAGEALLGVSAGTLLSMLSECLVFGAQTVVMQAGFSYASTIDPGSQADSTVLQTVAQLTANLLFFACGVDRIVLGAFARSLERFPPGSVEIGWPSAVHVARFGGEVLAFGLRLALPVAGLLLLADITLAVVGRLQAQLQLLSLAFPVKMLGALAALAALAPMMAWTYQSALGRMAAILGALLR